MQLSDSNPLDLSLFEDYYNSQLNTSIDDSPLKDQLSFCGASDITTPSFDLGQSPSEVQNPVKPKTLPEDKPLFMLVCDPQVPMQHPDIVASDENASEPPAGSPADTLALLTHPSSSPSCQISSQESFRELGNSGLDSQASDQKLGEGIACSSKPADSFDGTGDNQPLDNLSATAKPKPSEMDIPTGSIGNMNKKAGMEVDSIERDAASEGFASRLESCATSALTDITIDMTIKEAQPNHYPPAAATQSSFSFSDPTSSLESEPVPLSSTHVSPFRSDTTPSAPSKRSHEKGPEVVSPDVSESPLKRSKRPQNSSKKSTPGRPPPISRKIAHAKLAQPFRSPLLSKSIPSPNTTASRVIKVELDTNGGTPLNSIPDKTTTTVVTPKPKQLTRLHADAEAPFPSRTPSGTPSGSDSGVKSTKSLSRPFKSPFKSPLSSLSSATTRLVSSPNIQTLERKLQLLKRAVKIRADNEEEKLEALTAKWRAAGRDVAWEMWMIVKEQGQGDSWGAEDKNDKSGYGGQKSGWGWDDTTAPGRRKKGMGFETNWGYADSNGDRAGHGEDMDESGILTPTSPTKLEADLWKSIRKSSKKPIVLSLESDVAGDSWREEYERGERQEHDVRTPIAKEERDDDEEEVKESREHTLGTMLRQFGIADDTLGWNEDEEDFVIQN